MIHNSDAVYWLLLVPVLIGIIIHSFYKQKRLLIKMINPKLWDKMIPNLSLNRRVLKSILLVMALIFLIIAILRPQFGFNYQKVSRQGLDILIALDLSLSMETQDIKPSRFNYAKLEVINLINHLKGDRIGLIGFSGEAFVHCPLTMDYSAIRLFLDELEVGTYTTPGSDLASAIKTGRLSLKQSQGKKIMVVFTDGESFENDPVKSAQVAKKENIQIYPIGLGSIEGEPIPEFNESGEISGYKKNKQNEIILSKLNEPLLKKIANQTEGRYYHVKNGEFATNKLYQYLANLERNTFEEQLTRQHIDRYHWPLMVVFVLLLLEWILSEVRGKKSEQ